LDGFHYQYLYRFQNELTFLKNSIAGHGVFAENGMLSTFPTQTFPCHWTMATGLYHESHGIVGNYFYDPYMNETYMMGSNKTKEEHWYSGEPVWSAAVRQGKRVGVIAWLGSDVDFKLQGRRNPTRVMPFDPKHKLGEKLTTAYNWMFGKEALDAVMVYHNNPDKAGHESGAASREVRDVLKEIDSDLRAFFQRLTLKNEQKAINVVIVSDHGMTNITHPHTFMSDHGLDIDKHAIFADGGGTILKIFPRDLSSEFELITHLTHISNVTASFILYRKSDIPSRWHFQRNARIPALVLVANEGHLIYKNRNWSEDISGEHGYDNNLESMKAFFTAVGPSFKSHQVMTKSFPQVSLFPLFCHLLNVTAPPNNGSLAVFEPFLRREHQDEKYDWKEHNARDALAAQKARSSGDSVSLSLLPMTFMVLVFLILVIF